MARLKSAWDQLSMRDRALFIRLGLLHGLSNLKDIRDTYNLYSSGNLVDNLYASSKRTERGETPNYNNTISEQEAERLGYFKDNRGHRDDRVKLPNHPTHPSRGTFVDDRYDLSDKGIQDVNHTLFGLVDNGDSYAILTYKGSTVLPEITVTPDGNYVHNTYDNIKLYYANGGNLAHKKSGEGLREGSWLNNGYKSSEDWELHMKLKADQMLLNIQNSPFYMTDLELLNLELSRMKEAMNNNPSSEIVTYVGFDNNGNEITKRLPVAKGLNTMMDAGVVDYMPILGDAKQVAEAGAAALLGDYLTAGLLGGMMFVPNFIEKPLKKLKLAKVLNEALEKNSKTVFSNNFLNNIFKISDPVNGISYSSAIKSKENPLLYTDVLQEMMYDKAINFSLLYGYDVPLNKSTILSDTKKMLDQHNTFLRGVRDPLIDYPDSETTLILLDYMSKNNISNTPENRLKLSSILSAPDTGAGRTGVTGNLFKGYNYTSNSLDLVQSYAYRNGVIDNAGKVAVVKRPYSLGMDPLKWFEEGDFNFKYVANPSKSGLGRSLEEANKIIPIASDMPEHFRRSKQLFYLFPEEALPTNIFTSEFLHRDLSNPYLHFIFEGKLNEPVLNFIKFLDNNELLSNVKINRGHDLHYWTPGYSRKSFSTGGPLYPFSFEKNHYFKTPVVRYDEGGQTYTVKKGDTFSLIAQNIGVSIEDLQKLNPTITNVNRIREGQTINIPAYMFSEIFNTPQSTGLINPKAVKASSTQPVSIKLEVVPIKLEVAAPTQTGLKTAGPLDLLELAVRQAYTESRLIPDIVNSKGAYGLFQIMLPALDDYNRINKTNYTLEDMKNADNNIKVRNWYMNYLSNLGFINKGDILSDSILMYKTLAAFNAGAGPVRDALTKAKADGKDIYDSWDWVSYLWDEPREYADFILRGIETKGTNKNDSVYKAVSKAKSSVAEKIKDSIK